MLKNKKILKKDIKYTIPHSCSLLRAMMMDPSLRILLEREIFTRFRGIQPINALQHFKPCLYSDPLVVAA